MAAEIINEIFEFLQKGRAKNVKSLVEQALEQGYEPKEILDEGLLASMMVIGEKFKRNEVFVPEVLVAAKAMSTGLRVLEPRLVEVGNKPAGKAVIGTVKDDLHDIGKNLVAMMLRGAGFEVFDLGTDIDGDTFIRKAEEVKADIICMSALLTTTMLYMEDVINTLKARGLRDKYIVMVGGSPVTAAFAQQIGADYYTEDAASAADIAKTAVSKRKRA